MVIPGRKRASMPTPNVPSIWLGCWSIGSIAAGSHTLGRMPTWRPKNSCGATPTTVAGAPLTVMALPIIAGSAWNRLVQYDQLTTALAAVADPS